MSPEQTEKMERILAQGRDAVVGINRAGRSPHLSVVWFVWDGEQFIFSTTTDRAKHALLTRDAAISLLVNDESLHGYVAAYGQATILTENFAGVARPIVDKYMAGDREGGIAMITAPGRVLVRFRPKQLTVH